MKVRFIEDVLLPDGGVRFAAGQVYFMSLASAEKWIATGKAEAVAE